MCYSRLSLSTGSTIGEKLTMQPDPDGLKFGDKHSVAVMKNGMTVGDLPKDISCLTKFFIVHGGTIKCKVTGKKKKHSKDVAWRSGGALHIWYKGETLLQPSYGTSKTNWSVLTKHGSVLSSKRKLFLPEKSPFQDKQMSQKNNQILSLCSFIFMWQQPFQTSRRLIFITDWSHKRW